MSAPRALVTGGSGFVGQWLVRALLVRGYAVTSVSTHESSALAVLTPEERGAVTWLTGDLRYGYDIAAALETAQPDAVFHLAGMSFVPAAQDAPIAAYEVNALGAARLLQLIRTHRTVGTLDPTVLVIGSGEQYGRHDAQDMPLRETDETRPLTVYAASKACQEIIALQAFRSDGVRVIATRSFNHSGVGHATNFLLPALVRRTLALRASGGTLTLGNGDVVRDFTHVADVADAYCRLVEHGVPGEIYNVASGAGTSVRELAAAVLHRAGVTAEISTDPALLRPVDVPILVGSPDKLRAATGWSPVRTRDDIIDDLIHAASR